MVTDRWELPHSCLKTGRIIGSGAFGQVVKGRVSKSILVHRGISMEVLPQTPSTHFTVAIKMLQGLSVVLSVDRNYIFFYQGETHIGFCHSVRYKLFT